MDSEERLALIKRNVVEIVTEEELRKLLEKKKPVVYCGYEPSGSLHLGHLVTIIKLKDFARAGFKVKILLADLHAFLNRKGSEEEIEKESKEWEKTIKAMKLNAEIVFGSKFQFDKEYLLDVIKVAREITISRGMRSMQEIARDIEHGTISQLLYPLMQVADIKHLGIDVALGGMEQRKVHMIGREMSNVLGHSFVAVHIPLITSLKGPGEKMSKSVAGSGIAVTDNYEEIKKAVMKAYCPEKASESNPILEITKLIIFPEMGGLSVKQKDKSIYFSDYSELEKVYKEGKLHPLDLKNAVVEALERIIAPIRKNLQKNKF